MDIIKSPSDKGDNSDYNVVESNRVLNVYTSETQPPVIKRGGPASAVHRNVLRVNNNIQEMHKSKSSTFLTNDFNHNVTPSSSVLHDRNLDSTSKNDIHKSRSSNFNDVKYSRRKSNSRTVSKEPSWMNYLCDDDAFDFDSNLALFDKNALYGNRKKAFTESSDSSDSGGIRMLVTSTPNGVNARRRNTISIESEDFCSHGNNEGRNNYCEVTMNVPHEPNDVFSELKRMGIIPPINEEKPQHAKPEIQSQQFNNAFLKDRSFLQQPDIVQEVTKSQLSHSDLLLPERTPLLSIDTPPHLEIVKHFSDYWKLDKDRKFPVYSAKQKDQLFECANKFGYDIRTIAEQVGKTLSDFVINQVGGVTRLSKHNGCRNPPCVAVLLGRSQASVFVASMARCLLDRGCLVLVYYDDMCHPSNDDIEVEIRLLNSALNAARRNGGFNRLTYEVKDLENKTFDHIVSGLDSPLNFQPVDDHLLHWCSQQHTTILSIDPPAISSIPWRTAIYLGAPTCGPHDLLVRTRHLADHPHSCILSPRLDGLPGLELDRMVARPDGIVLICDLHLPTQVYSLLDLAYRHPFTLGHHCLRLYQDGDLSVVE